MEGWPSAGASDEFGMLWQKGGVVPRVGRGKGQARGQRTGSPRVAVVQPRVLRSTKLVNSNLAFQFVIKVHLSGEEDRTGRIGPFASFSLLTLVPASRMFGLHPDTHRIQLDCPPPGISSNATSSRNSFLRAGTRTSLPLPFSCVSLSPSLPGHTA